MNQIYKEISALNSGLAWFEFTTSFHKDMFWNLQRTDTVYCACALCIDSHLSWTISYARSRGATLEQIEESLVKYRIFGEKGESKSTMAQLSSTLGIFNFSIYYSCDPVGAFSRVWIPKRDFSDELDSIFRDTVNHVPIKIIPTSARARLDDFCANKERENLIWDRSYMKKIR